MKEKLKKYIKEIVTFIIMLTVIMNVVSYYNSLDLNKENLDIQAFTLIDDKEYIVKSNKPIVIHFWATWCPTCKFEAANIEKLSKDYEVVTIAVQSGTDNDIKKYLNENEFTFNVVNDKDAKYSSKFNIEVFPTTLIYDKKQKLKYSEVGYTTTVGLYSRMLLVK